MPNWNKDSAHVDVEQLRQSITIQQDQGASTGSRGQRVSSWVDVYHNVRAGVVGLAGRELELARQQVVNATHRVTIRYLANVDTITWRVVFGDLVLSIGSVTDPDYRHRSLVLLCYSEAQRD